MTSEKRRAERREPGSKDPERTRVVGPDEFYELVVSRRRLSAVRDARRGLCALLDPATHTRYVMADEEPPRRWCIASGS